MAINAANQKRIDDEKSRGVQVGAVYKVAADFGAGSQAVYTDAGIFVTRPGVPGAYFLPDADAAPPFRNRPA